MEAQPYDAAGKESTMSPKEERKHFEPHEATETDAGNGQGTVDKSPTGETLDHPVMDGSTLSDEEEREVVNPRRGMEDPALIRDTEEGKKTPNPYG